MRCLKAFALAAAALASSLLLSGCVQYMEQRTPAGQAPPASSQAVPPTAMPAPVPAPSQSFSSPAAEAQVQLVPVAAAQDDASPAQEAGDVRLINREAQARAEREEAQARASFTAVYAKMGNPRIALFFNRALSDRVSEWDAYYRLNVSAQSTVTSREGDKSGVYASQASASVTPQYKVDERRPAQPGEDWMWRFEDTFIKPFLGAGVFVVDRATIVRLAGLQQDEQTSIKKIEMQGLKDGADVFVEILISRDPSKPLGYIFRATAKEVKTGRILATVNTTGAQKRSGRSDGEYLATSEGYQPARKFPTVERVSDRLAKDLMASLAANWHPVAKSKR
jgi:hypothetical protein